MTMTTQDIYGIELTTSFISYVVLCYRSFLI